MLFDLSPRVASHVDLARPLGAHLLFREIGADAQRPSQYGVGAPCNDTLPEAPARRPAPRAASRSYNVRSGS